ncbi:LLM class flavin-dependent oxidoreductase [Paraburkholderia caballeronis]|uniref:FMN-dependent oxidoreductase, nitrilotriacetate monooxygenase family n=1 Tax=Paraburkholderia caballeronis TaxID=416943 RepID=A0A1H7NWC0_9BURK|nr:LLM class flavin-dependent oxidoreductase [Paraburkholderia caballeronis]PXW25499.1 FMN-dependent oxidoreductase (nitrilotriacetate monooxygenase family) [Paraburkholderia caballeronis]PXX01106.1 FMN-dependent oxidoreductase (nitrilotriacetate monooxygenase family) [Paraburkholderia caballeronis]RAJ99541.1 FMN-dependent oxidoreductase (nitrilotriacetate monooxygenase family) [Paraburkholderia caballeronis]SEE34946.1 FMN-dependent oxidoreductase, nitrilotriacetate monooxygenase family [Parabu
MSDNNKQKRQIKLGAFLMETGHHIAAWRHPDALASGGLDFAHYAELAQIAERAKFDTIFFADSVSVRDDNLASLSRTARADHFEPLTLLSALSVVTKQIGLIATVSTTFNEPYNLARKFASLDHLSGGRAGWNLVTSNTESEAHNFNFEKHLDHEVRYERAREFYDVVAGLWDSWDDDAFVRDKASGVYFDADKLHVLNHHGKHFRVRGPLNVARSPQGWPVVVQAGASETGRELAAQTAEVIFVAHQTFAEAQSFYRDLKARVARYGRHPDHLKIMPGIFPVVGRTQAEAEEKFDALQSLIQPTVGVSLLSKMIGGDVDLSQYPVDGPVPELPETNGGKSRQRLLFDLARRENLTIRDLYLRIAGARGHQQVVGTPQSIADQLQQWFEEEGADGFNIMSPWLPGGLAEFATLVVPELQRRGLFRTEYEGRTLRENLGLPRPVNRYAQSNHVAAAALAG